MSNEIQTEQRLTRVEERTARLQSDVGGILAKWPGLESRVATLWELMPKLTKQVEGIDGDIRKFVLGGAFAVSGIAGLWLRAKLGL